MNKSGISLDGGHAFSPLHCRVDVAVKNDEPDGDFDGKGTIRTTSLSA